MEGPGKAARRVGDPPRVDEEGRIRRTTDLSGLPNRAKSRTHRGRHGYKPVFVEFGLLQKKRALLRVEIAKAKGDRLAHAKPTGVEERVDSGAFLRRPGQVRPGGEKAELVLREKVRSTSRRCGGGGSRRQAGFPATTERWSRKSPTVRTIRGCPEGPRRTSEPCQERSAPAVISGIRRIEHVSRTWRKARRSAASRWKRRPSARFRAAKRSARGWRRSGSAAGARGCAK